MEERKVRLLDSEALWAYALKALSGRAHSSGELREKLRRRAERAGDVDQVIARLKDCGYLDDQRYSENFAASRLANERFGRTRVIQDLRQHRVAPNVATKSVEKVYQNVDNDALIDEWVRKKYRLAPREGLFQDDKQMGGAYRRLLRAGFRSGDVVRALKKFARNPELLDSFEPPEEESD